MENSTKVATENAQIYKMVVSAQTNDEITFVNAELTDFPIKRSKQIADGWLVSKALEDYDTDNAVVKEGNSYITIFVHHISNDFWSNLIISWDMLTDEESEFVKSQLKMFN